MLAAIDARMGEVYWAEYQRDEQGVWHGEETEAVLKPDAVAERLAQLSGEWATVGTGWQAWPDLAKASGLTLSSGEIELPAAEDMLPLACYLLAAGKPWPWRKRSRFICETRWRGRNFQAASESQ